MGSNYRLSIYSERGIVRKHGYIIECDGRTIETQVSSVKTTNLKADLLSVLVSGLRSIRSMVEHNDVIYMEIPNQHLTNWLSGRVEYKKYSEGLDAVFEVLESIDSRYQFLYIKEPAAKRFVKETKITLNEGSSLIDAFKDLD